MEGMDGNELSIITWNLDGLDSNNLLRRTSAIVDLVEKSKHSIIFFQELIAETYDYIVSKLKSKYLPISGTLHPKTTDYFTATFLRINHVEYIEHEIVKFTGSCMQRNALITKCRIGRTKLALCNTHLESTAQFKTERVNQLKTCFEHCKRMEPNWNIIFGGDLNIRDKEILNHLPSDMCDLWIQSGSKPDSEYTWDLTRNTNKQMPSQKQPRCRFDRIYFRESVPPTIKPYSFELTGFDRVTGTDSFPSDHWGIIAIFRFIAMPCK